MSQHLTVNLNDLREENGLLKVPVSAALSGSLQSGDLLCVHDEADEYNVIKGTVCSAGSELTLKKSGEPYYVDGHMHLEYGQLSVEYAMRFIEEGIRKGLDEIDILDHTHRFKEFRECYDHLRIYPQQDEWLNQKTKFCSTLDEYDELIAQIRKLNLPIRVRFGLEVCYTEETEELLREILKNRKYDFLTGAVHSLNHILYDMSFSRELLWDRFSADEIYRDYYRAVMSCVRSGLFDRLAHPDTIKLFEIYPQYDLSETYQQLSKALNEQGMMAENNTGCHYRYNHPDVGLSDELLKIFKENGVSIMTASDAHKPEHVGSYIKETAERSRT